MRVLAVLLILLAVTPEALACSCSGIRSIGTALSDSEIVVIGRAQGRAPANYDLTPFEPEALLVEVVRALRGDITGQIRLSTDILCYRSFNLEDFRAGETYVFPLEHFDLPPRDSRLMNRLYLLPSCSHTALALVGEKLYTNELTSDGGRRRDYYMSLSLMEFLLPLQLLHLPRVVAYGAVAAVLCVAVILIRRRTLRARNGV